MMMEIQGMRNCQEEEESRDCGVQRLMSMRKVQTTWLAIMVCWMRQTMRQYDLRDFESGCNDTPA